MARIANKFEGNRDHDVDFNGDLPFAWLTIRLEFVSDKSKNERSSPMAVLVTQFFSYSCPFISIFIVCDCLDSRYTSVLGKAFGPVPSSVPLSIVAIAIFARLVEQVLLDVPKEIGALANSLGTSRLQYVWYFLLVEARSGLVLAYTTTTVSMVSYSTVMGVIGGGGIGDFAVRVGYQRYEYGMMYVAIVIMIALVFILQIFGNFIAQTLDKRK